MDNNDGDPPSDSSGILTEHNFHHDDDDLSSSSLDGGYDPFDCEDYKLSFDDSNNNTAASTSLGPRNIVDILMERNCRGGRSSSVGWRWVVAGGPCKEEDVHMSMSQERMEKSESSPAPATPVTCPNTPKASEYKEVNHQLIQAAIIHDAAAHGDSNTQT